MAPHMTLRIYPDEGEGGPQDPPRVSSYIERTLALGEGGAVAWTALGAGENMDRIEAELASIDIDRQKWDMAKAESGHEDDADADALEAFRRHLAQRLEVHAWRRCLHVAHRLGKAQHVDAATVGRFTELVTRMQAMWPHVCGYEGGDISMAGIQVRVHTASQVMRLLSGRGQGDPERVTSA